MRLLKTHEEKEQIDEARQQLERFVGVATTGEPDAVKALAVKFKAEPTLGALSPKERRKRGADAFRAYADNVLADDYLTIDEEMAFDEVAAALDVDQSAFETMFRDVMLRLAVARANDGRLSLLEESQLIPKSFTVESAASAAVQVWREHDG